MPKVTVILSSAVCNIVPQALGIDINEEDSISSLLFKLHNRFGKKIRKLTFRTKDTTKLKKNTWILVNGRNIIHLEGLNTKLHEGEVITICKELKTFRFQVLKRRSTALKLIAISQENESKTL